MVLGILFGLLVLISTSFAFFNFGLVESGGHHSFVSVSVLVSMITIMITSLSIYIYRNMKIKSIQHWPHTRGRIVDVNQRSSVAGNFLEIEYTYFMSDLQYTNNDFDYFSSDAPLSHILMMPGLGDVEKISDLKDKMIRVYYKPSSPYNSYISCNVVQNPLVVLLPSLIIIPACLFLLFRLVFM
jgi:hypothetical protein